MGKRAPIAYAALSFLIMMFANASSSLGQAGSTGGTIGQQDKSASGSEEFPHPARPSQKRAAHGGSSEESPHPAKPLQKRAAHDGNRRPKITSSGSITGQWHWDIKCPSANFVGLLTIVQSGDTFTGEFGHTNFWDNGTISNGRVIGGNVTFDREYYGTDHLLLHLSGSVMQGPHDSARFGHCLIYATKRQ